MEEAGRNSEGSRGIQGGIEGGFSGDQKVHKGIRGHPRGIQERIKRYSGDIQGGHRGVPGKTAGGIFESRIIRRSAKDAKGEGY